jgi:hypothetical protein
MPPNKSNKKKTVKIKSRRNKTAKSNSKSPPKLFHDPSIINTPFMQALQDTARKITDIRTLDPSLQQQQEQATSMHARVVAQMLRHHAQLFLRHAAVLERMAILIPTKAPHASWDVNHQQALPMEELQEQIKEEAILYLAKTSYQSMKCMRKRWIVLKGLVQSNLCHATKMHKDEDPSSL